MTEPTQDKSFEVYDEVWMMEDNKPIKKVVYSITDSANHKGDGTHRRYGVVVDMNGAGHSINKAKEALRDQLFLSKCELIKSLM